MLKGLFKNKKAVMKVSLTILIFSAIIFVAVYANSVLAGTHSSTVNITSCTTMGDLGECIIAGEVIGQDFDLEVCNDGGSPHDIREFRIYYEWEDFTDFINVQCQEKTGWDLVPDLTTIWGDACLYSSEHEDNNIKPGECTDFKFTADTPVEDCCRELRFETTDEETPIGDVNQIDADVCVDAKDPETTKSFIGPQKEENGVEWIDGITLVNLTAIDPEPHPSGVDKTWYVNIWAEEFVREFQLPCDPELPCWDSRYCESLLQYTHDIPIEWWKLYEDPFQKEGESCHVLFYYSTDKVGKIEDINVTCFFVDKTPPEVEKILDGSEITVERKYELGTSRDGTAEESTDEAYEGEGSVYLAAPLITSYPPSNEGRIHIPLDGMTLGDINTIAWMTMVTEGYIPHVDVILDKDGDTVKDDALVFEYDRAQLPHYVPIEDMNYQRDTWVETFDDKGIVDDSATAWLNSGGVDPNGANFAQDTLANWKLGLAGVDADTKVLALEIEVDGWARDSEAYVDLIRLNGVTLVYHWVTPKTEIKFTCTDQGPHPSEDEELCFKVSYDEDPDGYNTDEYCAKYSGEGAYMEGDWCCIDASPDSAFVFNFNEDEDSIHDLVYYCRDAVEKRTPTYIQYYKVDSTPPKITKEMIGDDHLGDCPPGPNPKEPCFVSDDGKNGVRIYYEDPEVNGCAVNEVECSVELWLGSTNLDQNIEEFPHFGYIDVIFKEDSTHTLKVNCKDALGNKMEEDVEEFLVDSKPPEIIKKIVGPSSGICPPEEQGDICYIDGITKIHVEAIDEKVGQVSDILCEWKYKVLDGTNIGSTGGSTNPIIPPFDINFPEESTHELTITCWDIFGNKVSDIEEFIVDKTGPKITKRYEGPQYPDPIKPETDYPHYINSETTLIIEVEDAGTHTSGLEETKYRYDIVDDGYCDGTLRCEDATTTKDWIKLKDPAYGEFNIPDDSCHLIEIMSKDNVDKESTHKQCVFVDNKSPKIEKTVGDPKMDCPPGIDGGMDCHMIDGKTEIRVDAPDQEPHPVDEVLCSWDYEVIDGVKTGEGETEITPPFKIIFPEESTHILTIKCWDKLGNTKEDVEKFIVDMTPPGIWKEYNETLSFYAEFQDYWADWISSRTPIYAGVTDDGLHTSGIKEVRYRTTIVDEEYCKYYREKDKHPCEDATGGETWKYVDPKDFNEFEFKIDTKSCHLIEIEATDNVDKSRLHKQCVFVDNTPPTPVKEVGEPKTEWDGSDSDFYPWIEDYCKLTEEEDSCLLGKGCIDCWKVTLDTEISMTCLDEGDHPVNNEKICFNVQLDGEDWTDEEEYSYCDHYGGTMEGDYCCLSQTIKDFYFLESSEHNLKFYCVDALGNNNELDFDEEKFKVEGNDFTIQINKKWNLISVPVVLLDPDIKEVIPDSMGDIIKSVWAYDPTLKLCGDEWCVYTPDGDDSNDDLHELTPGWGYWVLAYDETEIVIGGSLLSPNRMPPSRDLVDGWNLLGYYGLDSQTGYYGPVGNGEKVACALGTLCGPLWFEEWGSVVTYWQPESDPWVYLGRYEGMDPGAGYWVFMRDDGEYSKATSCCSLFGP